MGTGLYKFVQTPSVLLIMFRDVIGYRQIFLDGRPHPKDADPSWMGHSIAHWEGDALVVDAIAIKDRSPLLIYPHTGKVHLTERYHRRDFGHLAVRVVVEDPETFKRPWKIDKELSLARDQDVTEYVCNENSQDPRVPSTK
jgi:hypothetical protein